jgi:transcriptional regulator with XRE-family HTH domain
MLQRSMTKVQFDFRRFYQAIDAARRERGLTWRRVAAEAGVSASSLTRFSHGSRPDVETVVSLCTWAALDLGGFVPPPSKSDHLTMATAYLRSDPSLAPDAAVALEELLRANYSRLKSPAEGKSV